MKSFLFSPVFSLEVSVFEKFSLHLRFQKFFFDSTISSQVSSVRKVFATFAISNSFSLFKYKTASRPLLGQSTPIFKFRHSTL